MNTPATPDRLIIDFHAEHIDEVPLLGCYHYARAHAPLLPHRHPSVFEVCLLEGGTQTYFVGPTRYDLTGGDVFLTQPGETHGTGGEPEHKGLLYWLQFCQVGPGRSFLGLTPAESQKLLRRFASLPLRHFHKGHMLSPTFERILRAHAQEHDPLRAANVRNLLLRLVLDILAVAERHEAMPYSAGVTRAIRHIEHYFGEPVTVAQLAQIAGMSESHFKAMFRRETGVPPIEYLQWRRIEHAKHVLRSADLSITRIALDGGFATNQHFATVFKRLTGLTPRAFRRQAKVLSLGRSPVSGSGPRFHPVTPGFA